MIAGKASSSRPMRSTNSPGLKSPHGRHGTAKPQPWSPPQRAPHLLRHLPLKTDDGLLHHHTKASSSYPTTTNADATCEFHYQFRKPYEVDSQGKSHLKLYNNNNSITVQTFQLHSRGAGGASARRSQSPSHI